MKSFSNKVPPNISISSSVASYLNTFAKNMTSCGICMGIYSPYYSKGKLKKIEIIDVFMPKQMVGHEKTSPFYKGIDPNTEKYDNISVFFRNSLNNSIDEFTKKDFEYFMNLSCPKDWIIVGEATSNELVIWFMDYEYEIAYSYSLSGKNTDKKFIIRGNDAITDEEMKKEIVSNCINKYSESTSVYKPYDAVKTTAKIVSKSELNESDVDIFTLV